MESIDSYFAVGVQVDATEDHEAVGGLVSVWHDYVRPARARLQTVHCDRIPDTVSSVKHVHIVQGNVQRAAVDVVVAATIDYQNVVTF